MRNYRAQLPWLAIPAAIALAAPFAASQQAKARLPDSLRLYVFNCGAIYPANADGYSLKKEEVARLDFSVPCFLVAHPKGTMMWDVGVIPDAQIPTSSPTAVSRSSTPLLPQLAGVGYRPADITYLALSHLHGDHVANANLFAGSTWLVSRAERDAMFSFPPPAPAAEANYSALRKASSITITDDEYDVFKDGTVIIKSAPGHTPGHQVLFLKLAKTGPVVLSGDLFHYPEERSLNRLPIREFNREQTAASRAAVEAFLKKTGAQLWIEHDFDANAKLKKAPAYYD